MSPQQYAGEPASVADDVYGLGAILCFAATGAEPSWAPDAFSLLDRPLELMNPAICPPLTRVIARCLNSDPAKRFPSMAALETTLAAIEGEAPRIPAEPAESPGSPPNKKRGVATGT